MDLLTAYGGHRIDSPADLDKELPAYVRTLSDELARAGRASLLNTVANSQRALEATLPDADADRSIPVLSVRGGGMTLESYVRTRVVELVVHTDDLLVSIDAPHEAPPAPAARVAIRPDGRARASPLRRHRGDQEPRTTRPGWVRVVPRLLIGSDESGLDATAEVAQSDGQEERAEPEEHGVDDVEVHVGGRR